MFKLRAAAYWIANNNRDAVLMEYAMVQSGTWFHADSDWNSELSHKWLHSWVRVHKDQLSIKDIREKFGSGYVRLTKMHPKSLTQLRKYGWMLNDPLAHEWFGDRVTVRMPYNV